MDKHPELYCDPQIYDQSKVLGKGPDPDCGLCEPARAFLAYGYADGYGDGYAHATRNTIPRVVILANHSAESYAILQPGRVHAPANLTALYKGSSKVTVASELHLVFAVLKEYKNAGCSLEVAMSGSSRQSQRRRKSKCGQHWFSSVQHITFGLGSTLPATAMSRSTGDRTLITKEAETLRSKDCLTTVQVRWLCRWYLLF